MSANPSVFITGPGIGISPASSYFVANAFSAEWIRITLPYWDYATRSINYRTNFAYYMYDGSTGDTCFGDVLELIWQDCQQDFLRANQPDPLLTEVTILNQTYQEVLSNNLPFAQLEVVAIDPQPNGWYNTTNPVFAKYGFMKPKLNDFFVGAPLWINEAKSFHVIGDLADTLAVQFVGNTVGAILTQYGRLLPPQLTYTGNQSGTYP